MVSGGALACMSLVVAVLGTVAAPLPDRGPYLAVAGGSPLRRYLMFLSPTHAGGACRAIGQRACPDRHDPDADSVAGDPVVQQLAGLRQVRLRIRPALRP